MSKISYCTLGKFLLHTYQFLLHILCRKTHYFRPWNIASDVVTDERIKWAFDCMSPFKSPGEDGIFPALMQKGITYLLNPIKCIYRASLPLAIYPWHGELQG